MIPNNANETKKKTGNAFDELHNAIHGVRKTLYVCMGITAVVFGANKCADNARESTLENEVRRYGDRIEQTQQTLRQNARDVQYVKENGFVIADPCYEQTGENTHNVTPCYNQKTD